MKGGFHGLSGLVLLFVGCAVAGCDDPPKTEKPSEPVTPAKQTAPPAAVPAPVPPSEPPKTPTKELEDCEPGPKIVLSNEDVEAHIRMKAQKPEGDITTHDLGRITSVNFSRVALDTLDTCMFVHMKNLKELFIGPGKVWDLSPLAALTNLETVRMAGNPIEDLSPLALMVKMDRLDISDTKVKDLSPLKNMNRLTEVTLDGSLVEDISALKESSNLELLSIRRTQIKSLEPLSESKNLKQLFIAESAIASDIAATGVVAKNGTKIISE